MLSLLLLTIGLASVLSVAAVMAAGAMHQRQAAANQARRRAQIGWQQRQAEQQIQAVTHAAFDAMLQAARSDHRDGTGPWPG